MSQKNNLAGQRFGNLVAMEATAGRKNGYTIWRCVCDCGRTAEIASRSLKNGWSTTCGAPSCEYAAKEQKLRARYEDLTGKRFGLRVQGESGGCELVAQNLYFLCKLKGLAGNTGLCVMGSDGHYTDIVVVDYTTGIHLLSGGSNRLTRCHVWGGCVPSPKHGEMREMLKDSVNFWIGKNCAAAVLRDCYADTGAVGFLCEGWETRIFGGSYFWNRRFDPDANAVVFKQPGGSMLVSGFCMSKTIPNVKTYEGCGRVEWRDMIYRGDKLDRTKDFMPAKCRFAGSEPSSVNLAE